LTLLPPAPLKKASPGALPSISNYYIYAILMYILYLALSLGVEMEL
jgi:hypothetical protein